MDAFLVALVAVLLGVRTVCYVFELPWRLFQRFALGRRYVSLSFLEYVLVGGPAWAAAMV